ncbi:MAG: hypothetical protein Q7U86_11090 [Draconibacterium sp.]|nr:hypothetical protein [Draconibacterium sp.]
MWGKTSASWRTKPRQRRPKEQQQIANAINRRTEFRVLSTDFIEKFDAEPEK